MITIPAISGQRIGVFGLARTGISAARAIIASGAQPLCWDDGAEGRARAQAAGLPLEDLNDTNFAALDALLLAPGVPLTHPVPHPLVVKAKTAGIPVIGDTELFARARADLPPCIVISITGTNGKSTTTALIDHVLNTAGVPSRIIGNFGLPILDTEPLQAGGVYVLEISSYQIDLTHTLASDVAIITNMSPDHLDRHGDMAGYAAAKRRLFALQNHGQRAVIGQDDQFSREMAGSTAADVIPISAQRVLAGGISVVGGALTVDGQMLARQADWPNLAGPHNAQNAAAAFAACQAVGVPVPAILAGFASYPGLAHRMQTIAHIGGVAYVNDSKATNPTSTAPALAAFPAIHWIAGGRRKSDELDACMPHMGNVKGAYLIGEAAQLFAGLLEPHVPVTISGTLDLAVVQSAGRAVPGDTVLLSPACASQDQFTDFEARGAAFAAAVAQLELSEAGA